MISSILAAFANNFQILWPLYFAQYGFGAADDAPAVNMYFGPKYLTIQNAPPQITIVLGDEPFVGSEVHSSQPASAPRQLSRFWTRMHFYCWGNPSDLPMWSPTTAETALENVAPTTANQNGFWFQATGSGTTGATEPVWPTTVGDTVVDGTVTWMNMGTVDGFRIFDTDVTDLMRIVVAASMHYTLVGTYRPIRGSWYDKTDLLVMDGTVNKVSFEVLIPVPDLGPTMGPVNSLNILGQLVNVLPA